MIEKIMYATKVGQPNYMEEVISESERNFAAAKQWAKDNGFDRVRIGEVNLSKPPDFTGSINLRKQKK